MQNAQLKPVKAKKKEEGNTKEKQTETSNKFSNKLMCDKVTKW